MHAYLLLLFFFEIHWYRFNYNNCFWGIVFKFNLIKVKYAVHGCFTDMQKIFLLSITASNAILTNNKNNNQILWQKNKIFRKKD